MNTDVRVLFGELDRAKMSNNASGNICRTGCGRPGQKDYGWKGPAFNCCFGTVACLVEHKRPVRHASVARTCEYLPDRWNAPLFSSSPSPANPNPDPRIQIALRAPVWLTWGRKRRCMQAPHAKKKAFQELLLQSLEWCNDRFALIALSCQCLPTEWHLWSAFIVGTRTRPDD